MHHAAETKGETIVQLDGMGPFDIHYLNPADNPEPEGRRGRRQEVGAVISCHTEGVLKQKLLVLYAANSSPDSPVGAWSLFDGTGREKHMAGDADEPPYSSVLAAMRDGWRVIQLPQLRPAAPGAEHDDRLPRVRVRAREAGGGRADDGRAAG